MNQKGDRRERATQKGRQWMQDCKMKEERKTESQETNEEREKRAGF